MAESADAADLKSALPFQNCRQEQDLQPGSERAQRSAQRATAQTTTAERADADLDRLTEAWPTLPDAIKRAMLAMLDSTD